MISPGSRSFRNPVSSIISGQSLFRGGTYFHRCLAVDAKVPLLVTNTQSSMRFQMEQTLKSYAANLLPSRAGGIEEVLLR
jgi:hypothetical protein